MDPNFMQEVVAIQKRLALDILTRGVIHNDPQARMFTAAVFDAYPVTCPTDASVTLALANVTPMAAILIQSQRVHGSNHRLAFGLLGYRWKQIEEHRASAAFATPENSKILTIILAYFVPKMLHYDPIAGTFVLNEDPDLCRLGDILTEQNKASLEPVDWPAKLDHKSLREQFGMTDSFFTKSIENAIAALR